MKNLKDEIEGILEPYISNGCGVYIAESPPEVGAMIVTGVTEIVDYKSALDLVVQKITSLIEQEKERAVKDWMDYLFKEHGEWVELDEARYRNAWEQYLAERKG